MIKFGLLLLAKLAVLGLVGLMALIQLPELRYDLGDKTPLVIASPEELVRRQISRPTFVAVHGRADFGPAFTYQRYGLTFTYFTLKPYGLDIVARTNDRVTDEWTSLDRFLGKMRPFAEQPFSYRIREIFQEKGAQIPADAYFLALDDVPELSGWQAGAVVFSILLWCLLFYLFFFYRGTMFR
jgi:hypothetical protein